MCVRVSLAVIKYHDQQQLEAEGLLQLTVVVPLDTNQSHWGRRPLN